jgi:hypothetical protein
MEILKIKGVEKNPPENISTTKVVSVLKYRIWKLVHSETVGTKAYAVPDAIYDDFPLASAAADILQKNSVNSYIVQVYDVAKGR